MGSIIKKVIDPANFLGQRPGGPNIADAIDPGGAIIKEATGSDFARKLADPIGALDQFGAPVAQVIPPPPAQAQQPTPPDLVSIGNPPAGSTIEENKRLAKAGGFRSNLFTGGLGLKSSPSNISKRKLGAG